MPESFQLKVSLKYSKPLIWRRIVVLATITLSKLHQVLQITMGWTDSHLHAFNAQGIEYGNPDFDEDFELEMEDEKRVKLNQLVHEPKDRFFYEYDFGDSWEHEIVLEKIVDAALYDNAVCINGARACPPEDVGGVYGYQQFLKAISDKNSLEYKDWIDWVSGDFDPERLDLPEINYQLQGIKLRRSKRS